MKPQRRLKPQRQRGQSTVEFALVLPLILIVSMAVVQVGLVVYAKLGVTHLAREIARAVSVDPDADIGLLVQDRSVLGSPEPEVTVHFEEGLGADRKVVVVTVLYKTEAIINLFDAVSSSFEVRASVRMIQES